MMNIKLKTSTVCIIFALAGVPVTAGAFSQECDNDKPQSTPESRFTIMGDDVKDNQTGLIWRRCSLGQDWNGSSCIGEAQKLNWKTANKRTKDMQGYRLPTYAELTTILETKCYNPSINTDVFPQTVAKTYWTKTQVKTDPEEFQLCMSLMGETDQCEKVKFVDFMHGEDFSHHSSKSLEMYVRPVKSK